MDESIQQPNRLGRRLKTGHHSGVAHFTGMVAHIGGIRQRKRDDGNEMTETKMTAIFTFSLTQVGHLDHDVLTPAADSF
jgi:hypothetical protein